MNANIINLNEQANFEIDDNNKDLSKSQPINLRKKIIIIIVLIVLIKIKYIL